MPEVICKRRILHENEIFETKNAITLIGVISEGSYKVPQTL